MKLRAVIALTVCLSLIGSSVVPAGFAPCCCSSKKTETSCCAVPSVAPSKQVPSCCQPATNETFYTTIDQIPLPEACGMIASQATVKCMCASHSKPPAISELRPSVKPTGDLVSFVMLEDEACKYCPTTSSLVQQASDLPHILPILKSCSLRI